jgi:hypothetical protein
MPGERLPGILFPIAAGLRYFSCTQAPPARSRWTPRRVIPTETSAAASRPHKIQAKAICSCNRSVPRTLHVAMQVHSRPDGAHQCFRKSMCGQARAERLRAYAFPFRSHRDTTFAGPRFWERRRRRAIRSYRRRSSPILAAEPPGDALRAVRSPGRARRKPLKPLRGECRVIPAYSW